MVRSVDEFRIALSDPSFKAITLAKGTYEIRSTLSVHRNVLIQAEVSGSVLLVATALQGVLRISSNAELIGLNITGGREVAQSDSNQSTFNCKSAGSLYLFRSTTSKLLTTSYALRLSAPCLFFGLICSFAFFLFAQEEVRSS